eukprot:767511-Hanusia_phi.AAC.2
MPAAAIPPAPPSSTLPWTGSPVVGYGSDRALCKTALPLRCDSCLRQSFSSARKEGNSPCSSRRARSNVILVELIMALK